MEAPVSFNESSGRFLNGLPFLVRSAIKVHIQSMVSEIRKYAPRVIFTSGFRSPGHNKSIGGTVNSYHQYGCALDIRLGTISQIEMDSLSSIGYRFLSERDHIHCDCVKDFTLPSSG